MRLRMILDLDLSDEIGADETAAVLDYIPQAIASYSGCLESDHPAHLIKGADVTSLIVPRADQKQGSRS